MKFLKIKALYFNISVVHFLVLLLLSATVKLSAQSDTIYTKHGDRVIGNIKSMSFGLLKVNAVSGNSDFIIKWKEVSKIKSTNKFRIYDTDGDFYIGYISKAEGKTKLYSKSDTVDMKYVDIVGIDRVEKNFSDKIKLGLNLGYSYTKANRTEQITMRSFAGFKEDVWSINASFNAYLSIIDTVQSARRDGTVSYRYFFKNNWFATSSLDFLNSDEQKLRLRTTGLLGLGSNIMRRQNANLLLIAGAAFNEEIYNEEVGERNLSYEGFLTVEYNLFGSGDVSIRTNGTIFPSFTEKNRYRLQYVLDFQWALPKDFNLVLGYSINYDNKPPDGTSDTDYVVSLTFGWEF